MLKPVKHIIQLLLIVMASTSSTNAQVFNEVYNNFNYIFQHPISGDKFYNNEYFFDIVEWDGSFLCIGTNENHPYFNDPLNIRTTYIVSVNQYGLLTNEKFIDNSPDGNEYIERIVVVNENEIFSFGTIRFAGGQHNGYILKIDSNLEYQDHSIHQLGFHTHFLSALYSSQYNSFYVLAPVRPDSVNLNNLKFTLSKINLNGLVEFSHNFGGVGFDLPASFTLLKNGNFLLAGGTESFGAGRMDFYLLEVDTMGNMLWQQTYGYPGYDQFGRKQGLHVTEDEEFYLCGSTELQNGNKVAWLIKTDRQGNVLWEKKYNKGPAFDYFTEILPASDGTLIIIGATYDYSMLPQISNPMTWVVKMDTSGNIIWERLVSKYDSFVGHTYATSSIISNDGGIVMGGYVIHNLIRDENGIIHRNDAWLCKTDSCGFTVGDVPEPLFWHAVGSNNTVYIQNRSENYCTATLSWGDGSTDEHIYAYSEPIYGYSLNLAHTYTEPGTYEICLEALAGEEFRSYCTEVTVMPNSLTAVAQQNTNFRLFPNPSSGYVIVASTGSATGFEDATCKAYNLNGQLVAIFPLLNQVQQKLDISHLSPGVYVMNLEKSGEYIGSQKLVVVR